MAEVPRKKVTCFFFFFNTAVSGFAHHSRREVAFLWLLEFYLFFAPMLCLNDSYCSDAYTPSDNFRGACTPCPLMVTISCSCGSLWHASYNKPHKCHYGACPPCRLLCEEDYPCGQKCNLRCHGPSPPPKPEFTLKPKKKKAHHQSECTPGSPCPPCPELVWRPCVGQHFGAERMMVCSDRKLFSCDNLCGTPLPCGNHYCTKTCHALKNPSTKPLIQQSSKFCEGCRLPYEKERPPTCPHPCPLRCHPRDCPPCKVLMTHACHCGSMVHVFECINNNSLPEKKQIAARSCGRPCHRKLTNWTHLCSETCHPGPCPSSDKCIKKVTARCQCQTLKKEWQRRDVQAAYRGAACEPKDIRNCISEKPKTSRKMSFKLKSRHLNVENDVIEYKKRSRFQEFRNFSLS
ncbi:NF-X1-type zinc finger protein NFXL2 [Euphorbia peplus]|nr:NF-X1-type zinc finger protein NFXL2 [Euphorbia peplus]